MVVIATKAYQLASALSFCSFHNKVFSVARTGSMTHIQSLWIYPIKVRTQLWEVFLAAIITLLSAARSGRPNRFYHPPNTPCMPLMHHMSHAVQSCRGISVHTCPLTTSGLLLDRLWCVTRQDNGKFITARQVNKMALVRVGRRGRQDRGGSALFKSSEKGGSESKGNMRHITRMGRQEVLT